MTSDFDSMQQDVLGYLISQYKKNNGMEPTDDARKELEAQSFAIATKRYKDKHGNSPVRNFIHGLRIWEQVVIEATESSTTSKFIKIKGTAIKAGVSRNGIYYTPEELKNAAPTMIGKPFLKDHNTNSVDNILGKVTHAQWDDGTKSVKFEAKVKRSKPAVEDIIDGLVENVSIGAGVQDLEETTFDGQSVKRAVGITFDELSCVVVPGVAGAAIASISEKIDMIRRGEIMAEETKTDFVTRDEIQEMFTKNFSNLIAELDKRKPVEEKKENKNQDIIEKFLAEVQSLKEKVDAKHTNETPQPKGKVHPTFTEEQMKNADQYVVENVGKGFVELTVMDSSRNKWSSSEKLAALMWR